MEISTRYIEALLHYASGHQWSRKAHQAGVIVHNNLKVPESKSLCGEMWSTTNILAHSYWYGMYVYV